MDELLHPAGQILLQEPRDERVDDRLEPARDSRDGELAEERLIHQAQRLEDLLCRERQDIVDAEVVSRQPEAGHVGDVLDRACTATRRRLADPEGAADGDVERHLRVPRRRLGDHPPRAFRRLGGDEKGLRLAAGRELGHPVVVHHVDVIGAGLLEAVVLGVLVPGVVVRLVVVDIDAGLRPVLLEKVVAERHHRRIGEAADRDRTASAAGRSAGRTASATCGQQRRQRKRGA